MSDNSAKLSLPYLQASQAQKHVTHNEALRILDSVVQLSVIAADQTDPPATPADGDRYLLPAGATGDWAGEDGKIAVWNDAAWSFLAPNSGWLAWVENVDQLQAWDGATWVQAGGAGDLQNLDHVGINTTADATNRLAVSAPNTLLTHEGNGHQVKVNKAADTDTASLLFQTNWSGRAEMGTVGDDDFQIKVSADGSTFNQSLVADAATGVVTFPSGVDGLTPTEFGDGPLVNTTYIASQRPGLVTNATGLLGTNYNYPSGFAYDPTHAPNLPAAFRYDGHYPGQTGMTETVPVDPNLIYRLESYVMQEGAPGDWSAYSNEDRHRHYMGLYFFDADGEEIKSQHYMRYRHSGTDSMTTLAAPLSPGDTTITLTDASGWNESTSGTSQRGVTIFGYKDSQGRAYTHYSRLVEYGLFDLGQVNKTTHVVTLNQPLPASLGNPDDAGGTWPVGTAIANSDSVTTLRYSFYTALYVPTTDTWYRTTDHIGGVDLSGTNNVDNFPPGTAAVRPFWLPNFSNRSGGWSGHPDTGTGHSVWFTGVSMRVDPLAVKQRVTTGSTSGKYNLKVPVSNFVTSSISLASPSTKVNEA
ncbi:DUF2793 domain-containing protein [Aliiroseovarius sp.]|uniref:DUF2793 domain-containing protein n=1 Tax=Aliiroseovarius sp. TaxID=1872442 RepID=UPI003BAA53A4